MLTKRSWLGGQVVAYLTRLLFTFSGRISRKSWWIGGATILVVAFVLGLVSFGIWCAENPEHCVAEDNSLPPQQPWELVAQLLLLIPAMALTFKRLNDRDWPSWVGFLVLAIFLPMYVGPFFGVLVPENMMTYSAWEYAYLAVVGIACLWLLVDNGFLKGTEGPNPHGPDPLGETTQPAGS